MPALVNATVFAPGVNVPPDLDQFPETEKTPDGAINVPEFKAILVVVTAPVEPVNVPPAIVKPPLKVWVAVEAR